jgi:hypothetical protein
MIRFWFSSSSNYELTWTHIARPDGLSRTMNTCDYNSRGWTTMKMGQMVVEELGVVAEEEVAWLIGSDKSPSLYHSMSFASRSSPSGPMVQPDIVGIDCVMTEIYVM